jgi:hypothetical protein
VLPLAKVRDATFAGRPRTLLEVVCRTAQLLLGVLTDLVPRSLMK